MFAPTQKQLITFISIFLSFAAQFVFADHKSHSSTIMHRPTIVPINNLPQLALQAQQQRLPILVLFSTEDCPYCEQIKEDFLIPMLISGDYEHKVIIRELTVADGTDIIDFSGNKISSYIFSRRYKVNLYPTTAFIDYRGTSLTANIIGINTPSLFGGIIDDQIDAALHLLKGQPPLQRFR